MRHFLCLKEIESSAAASYMDYIIPAICAAVALLFVVSRLGRDERVSISDSQACSSEPETVESLIRAGQKIGAIKLLREEVGLGLKEAKHEVERRERELSPL
jgi:ribosomal protein L7/L12